MSYQNPTGYPGQPQQTGIPAQPWASQAATTTQAAGQQTWQMQAQATGAAMAAQQPTTAYSSAGPQAQYTATAYPGSQAANPAGQQPSSTATAPASAYAQAYAQPQQQQYASASTGGSAPWTVQAQGGVTAAPQAYAQQPAAATAAVPSYYQQATQPYAQSYAQQQPAAAPSAQTYYQPPAQAAAPVATKSWVGTVTNILPPNYGIVDNEAFYVNAVVAGALPQAGQRVRVDAVPNTDGGRYTWRCLRVELDPSSAAAGAPAAGGAPGAAAAAAAGASASAASAAMRAPSSRLWGRSGSDASDKDREGAAGGAKRYNNAPPPTIMYTADVALAVAANAVEGPGGAATAIASPAPALRGAPFAKSAPSLTEEEQKRAEQASQQLATFGDPSGIGAKLLAKMGFGAAEGGKGGLGRNEQGISAPVDAVGTRNNMGLGFAAPDPTRGARAGAGGRPHTGRGWERDRERARGWERDRDSGRGDRERDRGRDRDRRDRRSRSRSRSKSRSSSGSSSRSRSRSASPVVGRYSVRPPPFPTWDRMRGLASISKRYKSLYIPSDFANAMACWLDSLPDHLPLPLTYPIAFNFIAEPPKDDKEQQQQADTAQPDLPPQQQQLPDGEAAAADGTGAQGSEPASPTSRDVSAAAPASADSSPSTAAQAVQGTAAAAASAAPASPAPSPLSPAEVASARRWSARVMLFSGVRQEALACTDPKAFKHPLRGLQFLVARKGKTGTDLAAVGGAWEPQDGGHPASDPSALLATARRTVKQATGIDLTPCTMWIRFAEISYLRQTQLQPSSGAAAGAPPLPAVVEERVVVFVVGDLWAAAQPNTLALRAVEGAQAALAAEAAARAAADLAASSLQQSQARVSELLRAQADAVSASGGADLALEPSSLTVVQLQEELAKRGIADKKWKPLQGKKPLVDRLNDFLATKRKEVAQAVATSGGVSESDIEAAKAAVEAAGAALKEAQEAAAAADRDARSARKLLANPPVMEAIDVLPPPRGSGSSSSTQKLSYTSYSLDSLLDYSEEDAKESTFEVSLFAEMFQEMLQQRFGRALLRSLPLLALARARRDRSAKEGARDRHRGDRAGEPAGTKAEAAAGVKAEPATAKADLKPAPSAELQHKPDNDADAAQAEKSPAAAAGPMESPALTPAPSMSAPLPSTTTTLVKAEEGPDKDSAMVDVAGPEPAEGDAQDAAPEQGQGLGGAGEGGGGDQQMEEAAVDGAGGSGGSAREPAADGASAAAGVGSKRSAGAGEGDAADGDAAQAQGAKRAKTGGEAAPLAERGPPELLLLACRYFDEKHAGYLEADDLEDILYMVSPRVSRRHVQALLEQAVGKRGGRLSYTEYAHIKVPGAPVPQPSQGPGEAAADLGPRIDPTSGGSSSDQPSAVAASWAGMQALQARLAAVGQERQQLLSSMRQLEAQAAELRSKEAAERQAREAAAQLHSSREAALQEQVLALSAQALALREEASKARQQATAATDGAAADHAVVEQAEAAAQQTAREAASRALQGVRAAQAQLEEAAALLAKLQGAHGSSVSIEAMQAP